MIRQALVLWVAAVVAVGGCASLLPAKKEQPKDNAVKEEDIGPRTGASSEAGGEGSSEPGRGGPPPRGPRGVLKNPAPPGRRRGGVGVGGVR
jgi:hypothetical protein